MSSPVHFIVPPNVTAGVDSGSNSLMVRPQLGVLTLSAILKQADIETRVLDLAAQPLTVDACVQRIKEEVTRGVGIYAISQMTVRVVELIRALKRQLPEVRIVVGGPGYSGRDEFLAAGADGVVLGEADDTIARVVDFMDGSVPARDVPGMAHLEEGVPVENLLPPAIANLDSLPYPDVNAVDVWAYRDRLNLVSKRPYFTVLASRGCPFRCGFCYSGNCGFMPYRSRSTESVLDELTFLVRERGIKYVAFQDDVFGFGPGDAEALCEGIHERKLQFSWSVILHPTSFAGKQQRLFSLMQRAGLNSVNYGAQSSSPEVLAGIGRSRREPGTLRESLIAADRLGLLSSIEYIFGLPGDNAETMAENIRFACDSKATIGNFHGLQLLEGIPITQQVESGEAALPDEELVRKMVRKAFVRFYASPRRLRRLAGFGWRGLIP
jgi:anaerobic magnesium-protoporphyrin IX monomethyl ester cyclase